MRWIRSAGAAFAVALVAIVCPGNPAAAASRAVGGDGVLRYQVVDLGAVVGEYSFAYAVNNHEDVVGHYVENGKYRGFLWRDGIVTRIGPPGVSTAAFDINNHGQVVGGSDEHAFLWQDGIMTDLGTLGGSTSVAVAINDHGQIVGRATTATGEWHAVLWTQGRITDLGPVEATDVDNRGQIIGNTTLTSGGAPPVMWFRGRVIDLTTRGFPRYSMAIGINDRGEIAGIVDTPSGSHAALFR